MRDATGSAFLGAAKCAEITAVNTQWNREAGIQSTRCVTSALEVEDYVAFSNSKVVLHSSDSSSSIKSVSFNPSVVVARYPPLDLDLYDGSALGNDENTIALPKGVALRRQPSKIYREARLRPQSRTMLMFAQTCSGLRAKMQKDAP
eukprot:CAMPEP_0185833328 /NCGR_PEP_ID=MMETSP1353-20130828/2610_1 /TAXON_ID=1077150 /ORGANISM="Erythrolobus australicus, Strain CCMP3124" /LENGTH=146 /DNA_ID=CAMNT_0028531597 /DNA_START=200 /DNA_END=640 /DNA_ORIENTATION=+